LCSRKLTRTSQAVEGTSYAFQDPLMIPFVSSTRQPRLSTRMLTGPTDDHHRNNYPEAPQPGQPMLVRHFSCCICRKLTRVLRLPSHRYIHPAWMIFKVEIIKTHPDNLHTLCQGLRQCVFRFDLAFRKHLKAPVNPAFCQMDWRSLQNTLRNDLREDIGHIVTSAVSQAMAKYGGNSGLGTPTRVTKGTTASSRDAEVGSSPRKLKELPQHRPPEWNAFKVLLHCLKLTILHYTSQ